MALKDYDTEDLLAELGRRYARLFPDVYARFLVEVTQTQPENPTARVVLRHLLRDVG